MTMSALWGLAAACVAVMIYGGWRTLLNRRRDRYDRPRRWFDLR